MMKRMTKRIHPTILTELVLEPEEGAGPACRCEA